jgi:hypothetical protein
MDIPRLLCPPEDETPNNGVDNRIVYVSEDKE